MINDGIDKNKKKVLDAQSEKKVDQNENYIDSSQPLHPEIVKVLKEHAKHLEGKERTKFNRLISEGAFSTPRKDPRDGLVKPDENSTLSVSFNASKLSQADSNSLEKTTSRIQEAVSKGTMPKIVFVEDLFAPVIYEYPKDHVFYDDRKSYSPKDNNDPDLSSMTAYEFYEHQYGYLRDEYLLSKSQFIEDEPKLYKAILQYCSRNPNIDKNNVLPHTESEIKRVRIGKEFIEEASKLSFSEYQQKHRQKNSLASEP